MADLQAMNVLFQFTEGAKRVWNGELIAVPDGVLVYDTVARVVKKGNGASLIGDLPVHWDIGKMIDSGTKISQLPELISTNPLSILVVNNTATAIEVSTVTISDLMDATDLSNTLAALSAIDHSHSDDHYTVKEVNDLALKKSGFSPAQSDVIAYLLIDAMVHDNATYGDVPNGVMDNFEDDTGIAANTGDYDPVAKKIILGPDEEFETISATAEDDVANSDVTLRYSNVIELTQFCRNPLNMSAGVLVASATATSTGKKYGLLEEYAIASGGTADSSIQLYQSDTDGKPSGVKQYFELRYMPGTSESILFSFNNLTSGAGEITYRGAIGSASVAVEDGGTMTVYSDEYDPNLKCYVLKGKVEYSSIDGDLELTIGPYTTTATETINLIGLQLSEDPIIFEKYFPYTGLNQVVLDEQPMDVEVSRDGGVNYRIVDTEVLPFQVGNYKYKGGKSDFTKRRTVQNVVLNTVTLPDTKGSVTEFTVDTESTSGHVDSALDQSYVGQKICTLSGDVIITKIIGDGTANNSILFDGTLAAATYVVTAINQVEYSNGKLQRISAPANEFSSIQGNVGTKATYSASASIGTKIYITGGVRDDEILKSCYVHDVSDGSWKRLKDMPVGLYGHNMISYLGDLFVHGGHDGTDVSGILYRYDIDTDVWATVDETAATARMWHSFKYDGVTDKAYLHGGYDGSDYLDDTYSLDLSTFTWTLKAAGNEPVAETDMCVMGDWMYVAGGADVSGAKASFYKYHLTDNYWVQLEDLPYPRTLMSPICDSDSIYLIGGNTPNISDTNAIFKYTPDNTVGSEISNQIAADTLTGTVTQDVETGEINIVSTGSGDEQSITWDDVLKVGAWYEANYTELLRTDSYVALDNGGTLIPFDNGSRSIVFRAEHYDLIVVRNDAACDVTFKLSVKPIQINMTNWETGANLTPAGLFSSVGNFTANNAILSLDAGTLTVADDGAYSGGDFSITTEVGQTYTVTCEARPDTSVAQNGHLVNGSVLVADNNFPASTDALNYLGIGTPSAADNWNNIEFQFTATTTTTYFRLFSDDSYSAEFRNFDIVESNLITKTWMSKNEDDFYDASGAPDFVSPVSYVAELIGSIIYVLFGVYNDVLRQVGFRYYTDTEEYVPYIAEKQAYQELVTNGNFIKNSGWSIPEYSGASGGTITIADGILKLEAAADGTTAWRAQMAAQDIAGYLKGMVHSVKLKLRASQALSGVTISFNHNEADEDIINALGVGTSWSEHTLYANATDLSTEIAIGASDFDANSTAMWIEAEFISITIRGDRLVTYNKTEDSWEPAVDGPRSLANAMASNVDNDIYHYGGIGDTHISDEFWKYDRTSTVWTELSSNHIKRYAGSLVEVDSKLYAYGGCNQFGVLNDHLRYDPKTDGWTKLSDGPGPRRDFGAIKCNNKYLIFGGLDSSYSLIDTVYEYDPDADAWSYIADMPEALKSFGICENDGYIYIIGGISDGGYVDTVHVFHVASRTWLKSVKITTEIANMYAECTGTTLTVFGGTTDVNVHNESIYKYHGAPYTQLCAHPDDPNDWDFDDCNIVDIGVPSGIFDPVQVNTTTVATGGAYIYKSTADGNPDQTLFVRVYYKDNTTDGIVVRFLDETEVDLTTVSGTIGGTLSVTGQENAGHVTILSDLANAELECRILEMLVSFNNPANELSIKVGPNETDGGIIVLGGDVIESSIALPHISANGTWSSVDNEHCVMEKMAGVKLNDELVMFGGYQAGEYISDIVSYKSIVTANDKAMFDIPITGDNIDYSFIEGGSLTGIYLLVNKDDDCFAFIDNEWKHVVKYLLAWRYVDADGIWHIASSREEAIVEATTFFKSQSTISAMQNVTFGSQEIDNLVCVFDKEQFGTVSSIKLLTNIVDEPADGNEICIRVTNLGRGPINVHSHSTRW